MLHKAMETLDSTSEQLEVEDLSKEHFNSLHEQHHKAYDVSEAAIKSITENHHLKELPILTIEAAAMIKHDSNYPKKVLRLIEGAALMNVDIPPELLGLIRKPL